MRTSKRLISRNLFMRRDGRVVDGGGLENHCTRKGTGGSNPSLSARLRRLRDISPRMRFWTLAVALFVALLPPATQAQQPSAARNVVLITLDGLRWQEFFTGADREYFK